MTVSKVLKVLKIWKNVSFIIHRKVHSPILTFQKICSKQGQMFLSVLHTSFNTPALNCPLSALGYSNFLHFIPILSVKWALCVEYSMSFGVCHYHRHWKGTCNLQKYNPFVPATSYWQFMISSEFHFTMIRSPLEWKNLNRIWIQV